MDPTWLLLLLPLASLTGYWLGRRDDQRSSGQRVDRLSRNYFRGLNLLLNEQTDKALQIFIEIAEFDGDTLETQLALGNLFRRRGELDRAIRLHENLARRPLLSAEQRVNALLELGEDYRRAGLLDRAEALYLEVVAIDRRAFAAIERLIEIYEQEQEWQKALDMAARHEELTEQRDPSRAAHYLCELAELALRQGQTAKADELVTQASSIAPSSLRPSLLRSEMHRKCNQPEAALHSLRQAAALDPVFIPEIVRGIEETAQGMSDAAQASALLAELVPRDRGASALLSLGRILRRSEGAEAERSLYVERLAARPSVRVLKELLASDVRKAELDESPLLRISVDVLAGYLERKPSYQCQRCGFRGKTLHWQCPSCKRWDSTKPVPTGQGE